MSDAGAKLTVEQRLQALEDRFAIHQLITSYPFAIDSRALEFVEEVWTEDGVFDRGTGDPHKHSGDFEGAYSVERILQEVGSAQLQATREAGLAHIMTAPHVAIDGDTAVATGYTFLIVRNGGDDYRVRRPTANRWELVRTPDGWRIKRRTLRLMDGSESARELYRKVFAGPATA